MDNLIYKGAIIEVYSNEDNANNYFMLVEYFGDDFLFQVIRLDGYHRGSSEGFIRYEEDIKQKSILAVTKEFLIKEFKRSIMDFNTVSFKIINEYPTPSAVRCTSKTKPPKTKPRASNKTNAK